MSRPKKYASDAERQAAYRERSKEKQVGVALASLPSAPGIANMAARRRWQTLLESARSSLSLLQGEMATYYDDRSEAWQESERGENHQSDLENIEEVLTLLGSLESI
jgi:hypothetical protein